MVKQIAVIKGDGIGPEIIAEAIKVLEAVADKFGHSFEYNYVLLGGTAIDQEGTPLPAETIKACKRADAVLLGAVGGPKWDFGPGHMRPEAGLLGIRKELGLFANIRPVKLFNALKDACPLKDPGEIDLVIVRELIGGAYYGERKTYIDEKTAVRTAYDTMAYSDFEIQRVARVAFDLAKKRAAAVGAAESGRPLGVTSVDKANVLDSSRLWREIVAKVRMEDYPNVALSDMLVDNAAMQLIRYPSQFDVIVTENLFGDILSDEASMLTGSLGMLPSASLNESGVGLYEPCHGSAPDIAGRDIANPLAAILSVAMLLEISFNMSREARAVENAVNAVLEQGYRTVDIVFKSEADSNSCEVVKCSEMGDLVAKVIAGNS
ncbi:MAG: 3-isopropylmalate dehydrogenase [Oscillospiraceae bacterium]|nr:3-isopropylmalate dehydrogenase [Oscillospiraceae bacterium]